MNRLLISIIGLLGFCAANADNLGYSPDGGLVSFGDFDYVYDSASRLTEVWSNGTRVVENKYDALGRRFYSPRIARWLTRDPIEEEGGLNLYVVCNNDTLNKYDPNGCIPLDTVWDLGNIVYDICVGDNLALAADTAALMVPYVPAGASKLVKAAQLSKVKKICPGVKRIKVTYEYLPTMEYGFKHTIRPGTAMGDRWIKMTRNGSAVFRPGWGDKEIKSLIDEALQAAQRQGKIKPSQVDGFVYDTGRYVGAAKGEKTTKIRIHVSPEGKRLHAFPYR